MSLQKMKNVERQVEAILQDYPAARNSNRVMIAEYAKRYGKVKSGSLLDILKGIPQVETILRNRRKLIQNNNYNKYTPTDERVAKARRLNQEVYKSYNSEFNQPIYNYGRNVPDDFESSSTYHAMGRDI